MKQIHIGTIIAEKRKQRGLTQQALAEHVGISKPAVSKWESGQSYPDIELLPVLASFFDCTVDELLGYEPQLSREEVQALYAKLSAEFVSQPFEQVYQKSRALLKQYFSCWVLQFYIALLWINHADLQSDQQRAKAVYLEALSVLKRVEKGSEDTVLSRQALQLQAFCHLAADQPKQAIELLGDIVEMPMQTEILLAKAYFAEGDRQRVRELLQQYMYENLMGILDASPDLLAAYLDEPLKAEQFYQRILTLGQALGADTMHPSKFIPIYMVGCQMFLQNGKEEKAAEALERYLDLAYYGSELGWRLQGSDLFDCLEPYFHSRLLGNIAPRDGRFIENILIGYIEGTPLLSKLCKRPNLQTKLQRLKDLQKK
ncbi:MAG: helix-turn-helix transcriptional regulator [Clostridiales bacterium]|jgi:DNA-binding protein|nr:helix-turn-helix transcriptional regulator [Clostridiales bacterium]